MKNRERNQVQSIDNPDIASSTHDLKAMHAQPAVVPPEANRDKTGRLGHLPLVAGGLALTAAVIGGGIFAATKGGDKPNPSEKEPVASAPAVPGEIQPSVNDTSEVPTLNIEEYSTGEQLATRYVELKSEWQMAGATPELIENLDYSLTTQEYVRSVNVEIDNMYIESLFVDNWENNENLRTYVEEAKENHEFFLYTYAGTVLNNDDNPYNVTESVTSIVEERTSPNEIIASYRYVRHDNFDENNASKYLIEAQEGQTGGSTITWVKEGSNWKIANIVDYAG